MPRYVARMKLSMVLSYAGGFKDAAKLVVELEKAGLDVVWVPEAYSFDAISQVGYLAAITERIEIGTAIVNVYTRTAALMAMTAAGCDHVSDGRFILGLGASGPQVIEGFHGMAFDKPMVRIKEYIEACRMIWARSGHTCRAMCARCSIATPTTPCWPCSCCCSWCRRWRARSGGWWPC